MVIDMYLSSRSHKTNPSKVLTKALSIRISKEDMDFLKSSAEKHCRTLADEVRYMVRTQREQSMNIETLNKTK